MSSVGHRGPDRRALRVGDLVGGDAEDERLERASLVAVARQGGQHGETDLLGHVVGGVLAPGQPPQPCTAVAVDHVRTCASSASRAAVSPCVASAASPPRSTGSSADLRT